VTNYKLVIEYDGRKFFGWQRQKNTKETIQQYLEESIEKLLKEKIKITGAGRTDSGVSAYNQVANFKTSKKFVHSNFLYSLNSILPAEISIKSVSKAAGSFHSRFSAKKREYFYLITTRKKAIHSVDYYYLKYDLDFNIAGKLIDFLLGNRYYRSLCRNKEDKHNFECNLSGLNYRVSRSKNEIKFNISADRFLHSMVRAVIGAIIDTARGKFDLNEVIRKIKKGEKLRTIYLPPNALFLNKIIY
jgi:tRNA pseudouridine38-40 synthase